MKRMLMILTLLAGFALANAQSMEDVAYVRVVHASPDAPAVDAYLDGNQTIFGAPFMAVTPYGDVPAGDHNFVVTAAGDPSAVVIDADVTLEAGVYYTVAATGLLADITPTIFTADGLNMDSSMVELNVYHLSPGAPNVDVLAVDLDNAKVVDNLAYPNKATAMVNPMAVNVNVVPAGAMEPVVGNLSGIDIMGGNSYSVFAVGIVGGEGDQAFSLVAVQDMVEMGSMGTMMGESDEMMGEADDTMDESMMLVEGSYEIGLSGNQEVPEVMTEAMGSATATLEGNTLTVSGDFEGLSSPYAASHVHMAMMGENGGVIFPLTATVAEDGMSGIFLGSAELDDEQLHAFMAGHLYVNIHSEMHGGGEIRGQIVSEMMAMSMMGTPMLSVSPQTAMGTTVSLDSVTLAQDGFVVIHAYDTNGELVLTPPLGLVYLSAGTHDNVSIDLDPMLLADNGYGMGAKNILPMIHVDDGDMAYEFPDGPDVPVMVNEEMVVANLELTLP